MRNNEIPFCYNAIQILPADGSNLFQKIDHTVHSCCTYRRIYCCCVYNFLSHFHFFYHNNTRKRDIQYILFLSSSLSRYRKLLRPLKSIEFLWLSNCPCQFLSYTAFFNSYSASNCLFVSVQDLHRYNAKMHHNCFALAFLHSWNMLSRSQQEMLRPVLNSYISFINQSYHNSH